MTRKLFTLILSVIVQLACLRAQQTYHQLEIIPSRTGTAGELRLIETNGWTTGTGTNYVGMKAPASISTNYVMEWPNALPGGAACITINASGVISFDPTCAGAAFPVIDTTSIVEGSVDPTKELRFEVDGFTTGTVRVLTPQNADYTIAGTNISQTFSGANIHNGTNEFNSTILVDEELHVRTVGTLAMKIRSPSVNRVVFDNSSGSVVVDFDIATNQYLNHFDNVFFGNSTGTTQVTPNASASTSRLGTTALRWDELNVGDIELLSTGQIRSAGTNVNIADHLVPTLNNTFTIGGGTGSRFGTGYFTSLILGDSAAASGAITFFHAVTAGSTAIFAQNTSGTVGLEMRGDTYPDTAGTRNLGLSTRRWANSYMNSLLLGLTSTVTGNLQIQSSGAAGTATLSVSGSAPLHFEVDQGFDPISTAAGLTLGTSSKRWGNVFTGGVDSSGPYKGPSGTNGASVTLTCAAGEAVKNLTVSGGIVTSASCGAP